MRRGCHDFLIVINNIRNVADDVRFQEKGKQASGVLVIAHPHIHRPQNFANNACMKQRCAQRRRRRAFAMLLWQQVIFFLEKPFQNFFPRINTRQAVVNLGQLSLLDILHRTVDDVSPRLLHVRHEKCTHLWRNKIIGIHENRPVTVRCFHAFQACSILPGIFLLEQMESLVLSTKLLADINRSIGRTIIDKKNFNFRICLRLQAFQAICKIRFLVVDRNDDTDQMIHVSPL